MFFAQIKKESNNEWAHGNTIIFILNVINLQTIGTLIKVLPNQWRTLSCMQMHGLHRNAIRNIQCV